MKKRALIKICGLTREEDVVCVNGLRPDFAGFVFAEKSRRRVTAERAAELRAGLAPGIAAVGVFVDQPAEWIAGLLADGVIDWAQLHGSETAEYVAGLRALAPAGARIIQAFSVRTAEDVRRAAESVAALVLLDHGSGGTGTAFDWSLAAGFPRPWLLAGGIGPGNAAEALRAARPSGLDASSGLETGGVKDPAKMRAYVEAIRGTEEGEG